MSQDNQIRLIIANNSGPLKVFEMNAPVTAYAAKPNDVYAEISTKSGEVYKQEFYYGSSYLSSAGRVINRHADIAAIKVYDHQGNSRIIR